MATGKHPSAWTRAIRRFFRPFLDDAERKKIAALIGEMESKTTGEIHVHLVGKAGADVLETAKSLFAKLGLDRTDGRNGVLILISHLDHRYAIWGDEGIHAKAGQKLWERAGEALRKEFKARRYPEGVEACVRAVGAELARRFPKKDSEPGKNQLSDDVTES